MKGKEKIHIFSGKKNRKYAMEKLYYHKSMCFLGYDPADKVAKKSFHEGFIAGKCSASDEIDFLRVKLAKIINCTNYVDRFLKGEWGYD
jgi:hypothetical protein